MNRDAFLVIEKGSPYEPGIHIALQQGVNVIGRRTPQTLPNIHFSNPVISRLHCVITCDETEWKLCDSGSRHGTWLNDVRIEAEQVVTLANGDRISLSEEAAVFCFFITDGIEKTYDLSSFSSRKPAEGINKANHGVSIDLDKLKLMVDCQPVTLSVKEWQLLAVLYKNRNKVVPYERLKLEVWPERTIANKDTDVSPEEINILVYRVRKKLEPYGALLQTVRGQGCMLEQDM